MRAPRIAIFGSGSLAKAVCRSLAVLAKGDDPLSTSAVLAKGDDPLSTPEVGGFAAARGQFDVLLMTRDSAAGSAMAAVAGSLASLAGHQMRFEPVGADIGNSSGLAEVLRAAEPQGVVLCASFQSPWERLHAPSLWTSLLSQAGFGLSLPLQAVPAIGVAEAIAKACPSAWFVNACFPDAVNPVLADLGLPVTCGAGNVAMLAAGLQHGLRLTEPSRLKVLAHHLHLHAPPPGMEEAKAWVDDEPVSDVTAKLSALRAAPRPTLADLAGASAALVAAALATGGRLDTQLPGPLGLPGGYPVRVEAGTLTLRLPATLTKAEAVAFNQRAALADGVVVADGRLTFSPAVSAALAEHRSGFAGGCAVSDVPALCEHLLELRARLRQQAEPEVEHDS